KVMARATDHVLRSRSRAALLGCTRLRCAYCRRCVGGQIAERVEQGGQRWRASHLYAAHGRQAWPAHAALLHGRSRCGGGLIVGRFVARQKGRPFKATFSAASKARTDLRQRQIPGFWRRGSALQNDEG